MAETYYCENCQEIVAQGHDCERLQKIKAYKKSRKPREKSNKITPTPPRYDKVFYEGLKWLNKFG